MTLKRFFLAVFLSIVFCIIGIGVSSYNFQYNIESSFQKFDNEFDIGEKKESVLSKLNAGNVSYFEESLKDLFLGKDIDKRLDEKAVVFKIGSNRDRLSRIVGLTDVYVYVIFDQDLLVNKVSMEEIHTFL